MSFAIALSDEQLELVAYVLDRPGPDRDYDRAAPVLA
jgi:hypothetical protein